MATTNNNDMIVPAQILALSSSALLSGYIFGFSHVSIRSVRQAPSSTVSPLAKAQLWRHIYAIGVRSAPVVAAGSAGLFTYLAFRTSEPVLNGLAAAFTIGIAPWTGLCMRGVNAKLHDKAVAKPVGEGKDSSSSGGGSQILEQEDAEVRELLQEWAMWNFCRALLPLIGCGCGWWATMKA